MKYVFGPVPSRRLGRSLGISPIPPKTCNYSCIYCQLGRTSVLTNERKMFFPVQNIVKEVKKALEKEHVIDYITIVGDGEPTLYLGLGELIEEIKAFTNIPVAVITNGALLYDQEVRKELLLSDVVLPTLDAVEERMFRIINRPHKDLKLELIIEGMRKFREEFSNQIWMEVMLVKDKNDSKETTLAIKEILDELKVDKTFINVPIRPPAESWVKIPTNEVLAEAQRNLNAESIAHFENLLIESVDRDASPEEQILSITKRHPLREDQIMTLFPNLNEEEIKKMLEGMSKKGLIKIEKYMNRRFWTAKEEKKK
ncbi:MAG: radical SAM protein [Candidatus Heimdallarchaeota archaeon]|nr:MAG: radical SAM protein [Candidatus Heimdallarchaeota archaeon]